MGFLLLKKEKERKKHAAQSISRQIIQKKGEKEEKGEKNAGEGGDDRMGVAGEKCVKKQEKTALPVTSPEGKEIAEPEEKVDDGE